MVTGKLNITGNHLQEKSNSDVQKISIVSQMNVLKFPREIYKFFPNIQRLEILHTEIKRIDKEDFYGLPKIKIFDFDSNQIETIGNYAFDYQAETMRLLNLNHIMIELFKVIGCKVPELTFNNKIDSLEKLIRKMLEIN